MWILSQGTVCFKNLTCSRVSVCPPARPWSRLVRWPQTGARWVFAPLSPTTPSTRQGLNSYARGRIRLRRACMNPAVKLSPWRRAGRGSDFTDIRQIWDKIRCDYTPLPDTRTNGSRTSLQFLQHRFGLETPSWTDRERLTHYKNRTNDDMMKKWLQS